MLKTKTTSESKPAKAAGKPASKTKKATEAPAEVAVPTGVCPKGGDHKWKTEDSQTFCANCFEPGDGVTMASPEKPAPERPVAEAGGKKRKAKAQPEPKADGKLSAIDAAAKVLTEAGKSMNTKEMIAAMADKSYWTSPGGKTPAATLYSAILREIGTKGAEARFQKTERGNFAVRGA